ARDPPCDAVSLRQHPVALDARGQRIDRAVARVDRREAGLDDLARRTRAALECVEQLDDRRVRGKRSLHRSSEGFRPRWYKRRTIHRGPREIAQPWKTGNIRGTCWEGRCRPARSIR